MADYTLSVDVTANDHASETFKKIQDNAKNFKSTVENAGQSMQKFGEKTETIHIQRKRHQRETCSP